MLIDNPVERSWTKEDEAEVIIIANSLNGHTVNGWWCFVLLDWEVEGPLMDNPEFSGPYATYEDACLMMGVMPDGFDKDETNN